MIQISKVTTKFGSESLLVSPNNKVSRMCLTIMLCVLCFIFILQIHQGLRPSALMEYRLMNQLHPVYGEFCGLGQHESL